MEGVQGGEFGLEGRVCVGGDESFGFGVVGERELDESVWIHDYSIDGLVVFVCLVW